MARAASRADNDSLTAVGSDSPRSARHLGQSPRGALPGNTAPQAGQVLLISFMGDRLIDVSFSIPPCTWENHSQGHKLTNLKSQSEINLVQLGTGVWTFCGSGTSPLSKTLTENIVE